MMNEAKLIDLIFRLKSTLFQLATHTVFSQDSAETIAEALLLIEEAEKILRDYEKTL